jgi:hypothetical protein
MVICPWLDNRVTSIRFFTNLRKICQSTRITPFLSDFFSFGTPYETGARSELEQLMQSHPFLVFSSVDLDEEQSDDE